MKSSLKNNISTDSSRSLRLMFTKPSANVREDTKAVYDTVDNHGVGAGMRLHPFASRQSFFKLWPKKGVYHLICFPSFIAKDNVAGLESWLLYSPSYPNSWHGIHCPQKAETHLPPLVPSCHCSLDLLVFIPELKSTSRWFMVMNYTIHGIMYSYYTLKALKYHVPKVLPWWLPRYSFFRWLLAAS